MILDALKIFSGASGLSINHSKSEIMTVHLSDKTSVGDLAVRQSVRYLGIVISRSPIERIYLNFAQKIKTAKTIFNCWLQRDLSIYGRVVLSKAEGLSRLYPALSLC